MAVSKGDILKAVEDTGWAEVHEDDWPAAEALAARGLIVLGEARFVEVTEDEEEHISAIVGDSLPMPVSGNWKRATAV